MVAGRAFPDDPDLAEYWAKRRERNRPPVSSATWHLLRRQHSRCPLCRGLLLYASHEPRDEREWEQWHTVIRKAVRKEAISAVMDLGTPGEQVAYRLIHAHCRRRLGSSKPGTLP
jgi:RNA-directed DNA polymerase